MISVPSLLPPSEVWNYNLSDVLWFLNLSIYDYLDYSRELFLKCWNLPDLDGPLQGNQHCFKMTIAEYFLRQVLHLQRNGLQGRHWTNCVVKGLSSAEAFHFAPPSTPLCWIQMQHSGSSGALHSPQGAAEEEGQIDCDLYPAAGRLRSPQSHSVE